MGERCVPIGIELYTEYLDAVLVPFILANAEAGARLLGKEPPDTPELMEIFGDIIADKTCSGCHSPSDT